MKNDTRETTNYLKSKIYFVSQTDLNIHVIQLAREFLIVLEWRLQMLYIARLVHCGIGTEDRAAVQRQDRQLGHEAEKHQAFVQHVQ